MSTYLDLGITSDEALRGAALAASSIRKAMAPRCSCGASNQPCGQDRPWIGAFGCESCGHSLGCHL